MNDIKIHDAEIIWIHILISSLFVVLNISKPPEPHFLFSVDFLCYVWQRSIHLAESLRGFSWVLNTQPAGSVCFSYFYATLIKHSDKGSFRKEELVLAQFGDRVILVGEARQQEVGAADHTAFTIRRQWEKAGVHCTFSCFFSYFCFFFWFLFLRPGNGAEGRSFQLRQPNLDNSSQFRDLMLLVLYRWQSA